MSTATNGAALTAVAMSGGLDSSVAAWMLAHRGAEHGVEGPVVGLSMLLWDAADDPPVEATNGRCCGALDLGDARRVAEQAGIAHYTLRMDDDFRAKVVDPFVDDYLAGRTPSPCVSCNTWVKFDLLLDRARSYGARRLATGHYARLADGPAGRELHRAVDDGKDQSYFLFELSQQQLAASLFPLGELSKDAVRELAVEAGLVVAGKGESMEICFVADGIRPFVEREAAKRELLPVVAARLEEPAKIVDRQGRELGRGEPYYRYTVGQRRGLGVSSSGLPGGGGRLYVLEIDAERNRVVVGDGEELECRAMHGERLHWINPEMDLADGTEVEATVKIRSRHPGVEGRVRVLDGGRCEVEFAEPQRGVAPGQAAVFYRGSRVMGGCWIERGF
ncbi:MAG TPA: tRNA 2-thiouridine(34) synthase MnmA [Thermoanaerobaculia bacterium]|nr:tRNA 2-thiouridine(34) synthase MnmA [Thermoanaerobaculia bacterium]